MEGRVDFSLERGRLLASALTSGALGPVGPTYADSTSLGRPSVTDIARAGTPSSIASLGHYPNRFMPPSMPVHSSGAGFTLMGGYMTGTGHAPEGLKSLMPEVQQYWGEGYPRYVINNNLYPPYPFLAGAESLSLIPPGSTTTQQQPFSHRIYELHKDPYLGNVGPAVSQANFFGLTTNAAPLPSRPSSAHAPPNMPTAVACKQEFEKYEVPLPERQIKHSEKRSHGAKSESSAKVSNENRPGRDSEKKDTSRNCDTNGEVRTDKSETCKSKVSSRKVETSCLSDTSCKKTAAKCQEIHGPTVHQDASKESSADGKTSVRAGKHGAVLSGSGNVKTQSLTTLPTMTVTGSWTTLSHPTSAASENTQNVFTCVQPVTTTSQGVQMPVISPQATAASALPYYHTLYSHPLGAPAQPPGIRKVHATTYVPEIGSMNCPADKSLAKFSETRVKSETVRTACCRDKHSQIKYAGVSPNPSEDSQSDKPSDLSVKHSGNHPKRRSSDEALIKAVDELQKQPSVNLNVSGETGSKRNPGASGGQALASGTSLCEKSRESRLKVPSGELQHLCDSEALDYSTCGSQSKNSRCVSQDSVRKPATRNCQNTSGMSHKCEQMAISHVQSLSGGKSQERLQSHVTSSCSETKPDSTTPQERDSQNDHSKAGCPRNKPDEAVACESALNLSKSANKNVISASNRNAQSAASKDRTSHNRSSDSSAERDKRCGSAPPPSVICSSLPDLSESTSHVETSSREATSPDKPEDPIEHVGSNIPVGIAVARQRPDQLKVLTDSLGSRPSVQAPDQQSRPTDDEDPPREFSQEYKDREEFLRQQKAILAGPPKPSMTTALPPNLVVTGNVTGVDSCLSDELRVRPLASQWLTAASHAVNQSPWLPPPNPFALHSTISTPNSTPLDPTHFPLTAPNGFKIAQDSLTGQLFIIPAGDFLDQTGLWAGFPGNHGAQIPPGHFQHLLTSQANMGHMSGPGSPPQIHDDERSETPEQGQSSRQTPALTEHRDDSERSSDGHFSSRTQTPTSRPPSAFGKDKTPTPQSPPTTPVSQHDREKPLTLANPYIPDLSYTYPYPSSHLPYVFNAGLIPVPGVPVNLSEPLTVKTEPPSVQSRGTSPMVLTPPPSDDTPKGGAGCKEAAVFTDLSKSVTKCSTSVQTCDLESFPPVLPAVKLKEQCSQTCQDFEINKSEHSKEDNTPEKVEPLLMLEPTSGEFESSQRIPDKDYLVTKVKDVKYNPYTDPQILQAADGLELLSALAEKRSKSVNSETQNVLPSPTDSFKSDAISPVEELPPVDLDKSSGGTPRRDIKRPGSPKWTFPKKETGLTQFTIGGIKIPSDLESFLEIGLDNMDAMEVEMRMRLAELQRRYKEKQKELAKLQPKKEKDKEKEEEKNAIKRGPGRPRKRKFFSKKNETEIPTKTGSKEPHVKKNRLAEELVDRVFRKLPPVKNDKRSLSLVRSKAGFLMKRRGSTSSTPSSAADNSSSSSDGTFNKSTSSVFGERKFFKSRGANIAKGKFKPYAKRKDVSPHKPPGDKAGQNIVSDAGNLFANIENSLADNAEKKKQKIVKKADRQPRTSSSLASPAGNTVSPSVLESGLGLLARFASSALSATNIKKKKRKLVEGVFPKHEDQRSSICAKQGAKSSSINAHEGPPLKKRESDTETSDNNTSSSNQKRKPGRPKKCTPIKSGGTETIVAKKTKNLGLLQLSELGVSQPPKKPGSKVEERRVKLDSETQLKPLYLDDEWCRRRSERIFLSEPSPQASPNSLGCKDEAKPPFQQQGMIKNRNERDRDRAKVQKAKSLQELSQKVKRKYSKTLNKKTNINDERVNFQRVAVKARMKISQVFTETESESESGSDGDDIPLIALKRRPDTPEPRSCVIAQEELKDGLRVLLFRDSLFYEGAVKAIRPPDVYGVLIDNERGNRPHIFSQEEILKDVIIDVKPGSQRYLPEGTRVCAYWSQQFSCLYPGTVAKTSPNPHADRNSVNVEFDDGDSGRIPIDHIRLLPENFPLVVYDPNPLLNLSKRRRRTTSDDADFRKSSDGYFTLAHSDDGKFKKRPSKRDAVSGDFSDVLEEDSDYHDVFENLHASGQHTSIENVNTEHEKQKQKKIIKKEITTVTENPSVKQLHKKVPERQSMPSSSNSRRRQDIKDQPLLRPSAFDLKKISLHSQCRADTTREEDDTSADDADSSDDANSTLQDSEQEISDEEGDNPEKITEEQKKVGKKTKPLTSALKKKRTEKSSSLDVKNKSMIAAFLPARQLWKWSGKSTKRPGLKGKAKKEFYKSIVRGKEHIMVGDCAVFLSTGRPNLPYVGRIESMWEAWGGQMTVRVKWFYHPEETKGGRKLSDPKGALFESPHEDENDVQTISHKCELHSYGDYKKRRAESNKKCQTVNDAADEYYLAGFYDPTIGLVRYEADVL